MFSDLVATVELVSAVTGVRQRSACSVAQGWGRAGRVVLQNNGMLSVSSQFPQRKVENNQMNQTR